MGFLNQKISFEASCQNFSGFVIDSSYIDLNFSAGVNESYFTKGDYKNNTPPYVPKYNLNSGITFKIFEDFDANLNHKYIGSRYVGNDEYNRLEKAEEYNVFDLSVSKNYNNFKFKSSINNIFVATSVDNNNKVLLDYLSNNFRIKCKISGRNQN